MPFRNACESPLIAKPNQETRAQKLDVNSPVLKRTLHTLKGSLGTYDFRSCAALIHGIEDLLAENPKSHDTSLWHEKWQIFSQPF